MLLLLVSKFILYVKNSICIIFLQILDTDDVADSSNKDAIRDEILMGQG